MLGNGLVLPTAAALFTYRHRPVCVIVGSQRQHRTKEHSLGSCAALRPPSRCESWSPRRRAQRAESSQHGSPCVWPAQHHLLCLRCGC